MSVQVVDRRHVRLPDYRTNINMTAESMAALTEDIERRGLRLPAVAVPIPGGLHMIAGVRRWLAWQRIWRSERADLVVVNDWAGLVEWMRADQALEADRALMSLREFLRFHLLVDRLVYTHRNDRLEKVLAGYADIGLRAARDYRYLNLAAVDPTFSEQERAVLAEQIRRVDAGEIGTDAGYKVLRLMRRAEQAPAPERPSVWLKAMPAALEQLAGVVMALQALGVPPESLSSSEREAWADRLRRLRVDLYRIQKVVKP